MFLNGTPFWGTPCLHVVNPLSKVSNFKTYSVSIFSMSSVGTFVSSCPVAHRAHGTHRAPSSMVNYACVFGITLKTLSGVGK